MSWTLYESNPWSGVATNKREWYDPVLREVFRRQATYSRFVNNQFNLSPVRTEKMHITELVPPHADVDELTLRQLWTSSQHIDSRAREITFARYGGKLSLHEYDDMVN